TVGVDGVDGADGVDVDALVELEPHAHTASAAASSEAIEKTGTRIVIWWLSPLSRHRPVKPGTAISLRSSRAFWHPTSPPDCPRRGSNREKPPNEPPVFLWRTRDRDDLPMPAREQVSDDRAPLLASAGTKH